MVRTRRRNTWSRARARYLTCRLGTVLHFDIMVRRLVERRAPFAVALRQYLAVLNAPWTRALVVRLRNFRAKRARPEMNALLRTRNLGVDAASGSYMRPSPFFVGLREYLTVRHAPWTRALVVRLRNFRAKRSRAPMIGVRRTRVLSVDALTLLGRHGNGRRFSSGSANTCRLLVRLVLPPRSIALQCFERKNGLI